MSGLITLNTAVTAATPMAMIATANAAKAGSRRIRRIAYRMSSRDVPMRMVTGDSGAGEEVWAWTTTRVEKLAASLAPTRIVATIPRPLRQLSHANSRDSALLSD